MSEDSNERAERKSNGAGKGMVFGAGMSKAPAGKVATVRTWFRDLYRAS